MFRFIRDCFFAMSHKSRARRTTRLGLEGLEGRAVPATLVGLDAPDDPDQGISKPTGTYAQQMAVQDQESAGAGLLPKNGSRRNGSPQASPGREQWASDGRQSR